MGAPTLPYRGAPAAGPLRLHLETDPEWTSWSGVWRPYGRDLTREAAHLVNAFPLERGRVDGLACATDDWEAVAEEVFTRYGRVKVGLLPPPQSGMALVRLRGPEILRVRVLWP